MPTNAMIPSTLAHLRRSGVVIHADGAQITVTGATPEQIEAIRAHKAEILATLETEAFTGTQRWEDSALGAGIVVTYRQAMDCAEAGAWPGKCAALVEALDELLALPLKAAVAAYMEQKDAVAALVGEINEARLKMLEGRHLQLATETVLPHAYGGKLVNGNIF